VKRGPPPSTRTDRYGSVCRRQRLGGKESLPEVRLRVRRSFRIMNAQNECETLLRAGRQERSVTVSRKCFVDALALAQCWIHEGGGSRARVFAALACRELAVNDRSGSGRTGYWEQAIGFCRAERQDQNDLIDMQADVVVDYCQDELADSFPSERVDQLKRVRSRIDKELVGGQPLSEPHAQLLMRKASVLRQLARHEVQENRKRMFDEAARCAQRAFDAFPNAARALEVALCEWQKASVLDGKNEEDAYVDQLRKAEAALLVPVLADYELARLAKTRFYRYTYRPSEACSAFPSMLSACKDVRRVLRNCYLYAEAAEQLALHQYPANEVSEHLAKALGLIEEAIAAGIHDARHVLSLAFLRGIRNGTEAALTAIGEIREDKEGISWEKAIAAVRSNIKADLPMHGFALGLDNGACLSRLGTFVWRYCSDVQLAEALYRSAIRASPRSPMVHTNLARLLVETGNEQEWSEADRLLQRAQNFADRRFRWWRAVLDELNQKRGAKKTVAKRSLTKHKDPVSSEMNLVDIQKRFAGMGEWTDHQARGYELEKLIAQVARKTFGLLMPSYRMQRPLSTIVQQVDGYFQDALKRGYRFECKWEQKPATKDDVLGFAYKVDAVDVTGLFFSMAGFDSGAVSCAADCRKEKAILLVDGEELSLVMNGRISLDVLVDIKRRHFQYKSEVYFRVAEAIGRDGSDSSFGY